MRKLLFILSIFVFSSCESKFDGLQGGVFEGNSTQVTFDDNKAYFSSIYNEYTNYSLSFRVLASNSKLLEEFDALFKKYNVTTNNYNTYSSLSFTFHKVNNEIEEHFHSIGIDFMSNNDTFLMMKDNPLNPTGVKIYGSFKGLPLHYKNFDDNKYDNNYNKLAKPLIKDLLKKDIFNVKLQSIGKSFNKGEKLNFIFDYKKVGQNQILLTKPTIKPNFAHFYDFKSELEILIDKYENMGYIFQDKSILELFSDIQKIENNYLKSNYYLNKVKEGYTLENLEYFFSYNEIR